MLKSKLFTKTRREDPKDEQSKNAKLLIRAGFIHKEMAGVYTLLPLGLRSIRKIKEIIRREMDALGGEEVSMTALQSPVIWEKSGRWDDEVMDIWFKTEINGGGEVGLATTHEEPLSEIMSEHIKSYRDLPSYVYQFQTKFRNELRAKSGIMRGREFLMKDLYSFNKDEAGLNEFYDQVAQSYERIFNEVGIGDITYKTFASGGAFSKFSHEFQTICEAGEDTIYIDKDKKIAINEEVFTDEVLVELGIAKDECEKATATEVGNIFKLGTRFSESAGLTFVDEAEKENLVVMGSYGIGLGRLLGTVVEVLADEHGMRLPKSIAPFGVHLVSLGGDEKVKAEADSLYQKLETAGLEVFYDDTDASNGEKLAEADLIGLPARVVVSEKTISAGKFEVKDRMTGEIGMMSVDEIIEKLK